jgi:peptidoglycan/LPS O-acetylase OafA/YrhL
LQTLEQRLGRDNGLNIIRLVLATLVIISHSFPLGGFGPDPVLGDLGLGSFSVGGFFTISGYLITQSRYRSSLGSYAWKRALRIFPGYWACLIFTAFVAAATVGLVRGGWNIEDGAKFLAINAPMVGPSHTGLGSTLVGLPYPGAWNGSLWTLRYELFCYVAVGLALAFAFVRQSKSLIPAGFVAVTAFSLIVYGREADGSLADVALLVPFFLAGATLYVFSDKIPCNRWLAAVALVLLIVTLATGTGHSLSALPLAYLLMWLGIEMPKAMARLGATNDFSYGTYLYAFPVQQLLVVAGAHHLGLTLYILLSIACTIPLAIASWFGVERPAQRLNNFWRNRATTGKLTVS